MKQAVYKATGGLTASVGIGTSKLVAKIASELEKPDGAVVIPAGSERDLLSSMQVTVIPGIGPATAARLRQVGVSTDRGARAAQRERAGPRRWARRTV